MNENDAARIHELERRVNLLTWLAIIQVVALAFLLGLAPIAAVSAIVLLPILAFTHNRIPPLARKLGRLFSPASNLPKI